MGDSISNDVKVSGAMTTVRVTNQGDVVRMRRIT